MPLVDKKLSGPVQAQLPNGQIKTVKIEYACFNVKNDKDAKELLEILSKGVDVTAIAGTYIFYNKAIEQSLQVAQAPARVIVDNKDMPHR